MTARGAVLLVAALGVGCAHAEPYGLTPPPPRAPLFEGVTQRLTFGSSGDLAPAWVPGDTSIVFSWQVPERADGDRCLALYDLKALVIGQLTCSGADPQGGIVNDVLSSAVSPMGRLAFVALAGPPGQPTSSGALLVGTLSDTGSAVVVMTLPISSSASTPLTGVEDLVWKDEQTLVFLGVIAQPTTADLESEPQVIDVLDLSVSPAARREVPGTQGATAVAIDRADGQAYATFANDSLVYTLDLVTGQRKPAHAMGALGVPRDIKVAHRRMVAVVRGRRFQLLVSGDTLHVDEGGDLVWLNLDDTLPPQLLVGEHFTTDPTGGGLPDRWFRHPALSSDGGGVVAEGFPAAYIPRCVCDPTPFDTVITKSSDLFLVRFP